MLLFRQLGSSHQRQLKALAGEMCSRIILDLHFRKKKDHSFFNIQPCVLGL